MILGKLLLLCQTKNIEGNGQDKDLESIKSRGEEYSEAIILRQGSYLHIYHGVRLIYATQMMKQDRALQVKKQRPKPVQMMI